MTDPITTGSSSLLLTLLGIAGTLAGIALTAYLARRWRTPAAEAGSVAAPAPAVMAAQATDGTPSSTMDFVVRSYDGRLRDVETEAKRLRAEIDATEGVVADRDKRIARLESELRDTKVRLEQAEKMLGTATEQLRAAMEHATRLDGELQELRRR